MAYKTGFNILLRTVVYFDDLCEPWWHFSREERTRKHNIALIVALQHEATRRSLSLVIRIYIGTQTRRRQAVSGSQISVFIRNNVRDMCCRNKPYRGSLR